MLYDQANVAENMPEDDGRQRFNQSEWLRYMQTLKARRVERDRKRYYAAWSMKIDFALRNSPV